jgi:hypothetical protein
LDVFLRGEFKNIKKHLWENHRASQKKYPPTSVGVFSPPVPLGFVCFCFTVPLETSQEGKRPFSPYFFCKKLFDIAFILFHFFITPLLRNVPNKSNKNGITMPGNNTMAISPRFCW